MSGPLNQLVQQIKSLQKLSQKLRKEIIFSKSLIIKIKDLV